MIAIRGLAAVAIFACAAIALTPNGDADPARETFSISFRYDDAKPAFDAPAIELGNSNQVVVGEPLVAVGSPRGLTGTVTAGILSAVRDDSGVKLLQTDAAVNPGNSGGPLLNNKAQVIGVVVAKVRGEGLNFAIPINYVRGMLADLSGPPMDLQTLRTKLGTSKDEFQAKTSAPALPERWRSLSNGLVLHRANHRRSPVRPTRSSNGTRHRVPDVRTRQARERLCRHVSSPRGLLVPRQLVAGIHLEHLHHGVQGRVQDDHE